LSELFWKQIIADEILALRGGRNHAGATSKGDARCQELRRPETKISILTEPRKEIIEMLLATVAHAAFRNIAAGATRHRRQILKVDGHTLIWSRASLHSRL
jgi:hypothetical protein